MRNEMAQQQILPNGIDHFQSSFRTNNQTLDEEKKTIDFRLNTHLIKDYQETPETAPDKALKLNYIVRMNLGLVLQLAGNYAKIIKRTCWDINDMVSLGMIGLLLSIKEFDPNRGCQFSTFATWRIRQTITRGFA